MSDRDNEVLAAHAKYAQQRALSAIQDEAAHVAKTYGEQIARGDSDGASWTLRSYAALVNEAQTIAGAPAQQQQPQFSREKADWMRRNENLCRDPQKWAECVNAHHTLIRRGVPEDSPEYFNGIEVAVGLRGADGKEGFEIASPDTALEAVNNSQIARKYGPVDADTYNRGVQRLVENKKPGLYEPQ